MSTPQDKRCNKCNHIYPINEFPRKSDRSDGYYSLCKSCKYESEKPSRRKWYYKNGGKAIVKRNSLAWQKLNKKWLTVPKIQRVAYAKVQNALRNSSLKKQPCSDCGSTKQVEVHHHNYYKPLDIKWVCNPCHRREHARAS